MKEYWKNEKGDLWDYYFTKVLKVLRETDNIDVKSQTTKTKDSAIGYDLEDKTFGLFDIKNQKVIYSENKQLSKGDSYPNSIVFIGENANDLSSTGSYFFNEDIDLGGTLNLTTLKSIFMEEGKTITGNINFNSEENGSLYVNGEINGDVTFNTPNAHVEQSGVINGTVTANKVSSSTLVIDGFVNYLTIGEGSYYIKKDGVVREITNTAPLTGTLKNDGYIGYVHEEVTNINNVVNKGFIGLKDTALISANFTLPTTINISSMEDYLKFAVETNHTHSPYIKHKSIDLLNYNYRYHYHLFYNVLQSTY